MDIRKVKKLIELLDETGVAEIEIKEGEESVRISRYPAGGSMQTYHAAPLYAPPPVAAPAAAQAVAAPAGAAADRAPRRTSR
jgi:acetyl-CoA carboxylase biotin carboxyl carrier protein